MKIVKFTPKTPTEQAFVGYVHTACIDREGLFWPPDMAQGNSAPVSAIERIVPESLTEKRYFLDIVACCVQCTSSWQALTPYIKPDAYISESFFVWLQKGGIWYLCLGFNPTSTTSLVEAVALEYKAADMPYVDTVDGRLSYAKQFFVRATFEDFPQFDTHNFKPVQFRPAPCIVMGGDFAPVHNKIFKVMPQVLGGYPTHASVKRIGQVIGRCTTNELHLWLANPSVVKAVQAKFPFIKFSESAGAFQGSLGCGFFVPNDSRKAITWVFTVTLTNTPAVDFRKFDVLVDVNLEAKVTDVPFMRRRVYIKGGTLPSPQIDRSKLTLQELYSLERIALGSKPEYIMPLLDAMSAYFGLN